MELKTVGVAGTMESSDILITVEPAGRQGPGAGEAEAIEIELSSIVEKQFGTQIRREITDTLHSLGVARARVKAVDRGALNCVIRARVKAAVSRAAETHLDPWTAGEGAAP